MLRPPRNFAIALTVAAMLTTGIYTVGAADVPVQLARTSPATDEISGLIEMIRARGLMDGAIANVHASGHVPLPIPGSSVTESIVTLSNTGEQVSKARVWNEPLGSRFLEVQQTTAAAGQTTIEYWVLPADRRKCLLNGDAVYSKDGRLLAYNFWRNDPEIRFAGSTQLPDNVFPSRVPPSAFLSALNAQNPGSTGRLNMVLGRYGYMTFDLWAQDIEQVTVPAGTFRTLKIIMRVNADSVMKYWPAFLRRLAQPFFPKNVLYYDTAPPHNLVKFAGSFGYMAPEVNVEMTRVYIASGSSETAGPKD